MTDDIFGTQSSAVKGDHVEHPLSAPGHALPSTAAVTTTPPSHAYAQQQLSFAHRALGVGQPTETGSSASTIRPEYMNAQAHLSTIDVNIGASPFAFNVPADTADGSVHVTHVNPATVYPRSSSLSHGSGPIAFHPHNASHFVSPPIPPPRHSSLAQMTPQSTHSSTLPSSASGGSPTRVPALQLTQATPTKRKLRARPGSVASQETATAHGPSLGQPDDSGMEVEEEGEGPVSLAMGSDSSKDSIDDQNLSVKERDERRKIRSREKGRIRQQRHRAKKKADKLEAEAKKQAGPVSRNPSAPNLLHMSGMSSSASTTYTHLPHSQSFYSLPQHNSSFAFSSTTSLSGQSSPSVAYSPMIGTSGLYSPGYMTPNPELHYSHGPGFGQGMAHGQFPEADFFASAVGGSGGISFQPRSSRGRSRPTLQSRRASQLSSVSIDTSPSASFSMSSASGPRTAPLPLPFVSASVGMNPPPFKRRKSEPEPEEFRTGLGVMMAGQSQSSPMLSHDPATNATAPESKTGNDHGERPVLARNYSTDLSSTDMSETQLSDIELGEQTRSPTPPPVLPLPAVLTPASTTGPASMPAPMSTPTGSQRPSHAQQPASPGQTFASLILTACTDASLAEKLERQLNLGKEALGSLQSDLAGVYDRWAAANYGQGNGHHTRPSIDTSIASAPSASSSSGMSAYPTSGPTTAAASPVIGMTPLHPAHASGLQNQPMQQPMGHIATRAGKQLNINLSMTESAASANSPQRDDSPAHTALQTPSTGAAFGFHRMVETPSRQPLAHSQTEPHVRRVSEGTWLRGGQSAAQGQGHGQGYPLDSPLAVHKARTKPSSRPGSHRSTQSQSTIRAPVQLDTAYPAAPHAESPTRQTFPLPSPHHEPVQDHSGLASPHYPPGHAALYKHYMPAVPAATSIWSSSGDTQNTPGVTALHHAQTPYTPNRLGRDSGMPMPAHFSPVTPSQRIIGGQVMYGPYSAPLFATPGQVMPIPMHVYPAETGHHLPAHVGEQMGAGFLGAPLMPAMSMAPPAQRQPQVQGQTVTMMTGATATSTAESGTSTQ